MAALLNLILTVLVCLVIDSRVESSQDVIKSLSLKFTEALTICKKEMDLPDSIDADFINFWKVDYDLNNRVTGCAIMCLASKLDLVDHTGTLKHGVTHEFAKTHGADDAMAKQLVDIIHNCEKTVGMGDDDCQRAIDVMRCFKVEIHKLNWAPDMDLIIAEVLAAV